MPEPENYAPLICPECRDGKCKNCVGQALNTFTDEFVECQHMCQATVEFRCDACNELLEVIDNGNKGYMVGRHAHGDLYNEKG